MRAVKYLEYLKGKGHVFKFKCGPLFLDSAIGGAGDRCRKASVQRTPAGEGPNQSPSASTLCACYMSHSVCVCVRLMIPGAVDGGEAESSRWSVWRVRGAFVSAMPGAAVPGAGEGGRHRPAWATAGGAGRMHAHGENHQSSRFSFHLFRRRHTNNTKAPLF